MTLSEIVCKRNNIRVKEYERYEDKLLFIGGCFITGGRIIELDGNKYFLDMSISAWEWENDSTLMVVR